MSPEKMTDKEVSDALSWLHSKEGHFNEAEKLRAHIAALEAERDEARALIETPHHGSPMQRERDTLREQARALEGQRDRAEDELAVERSCKYDAELARDRAESRLSGILQRAGDAEGLARAVVLAEGRLRPEDWIYVDAAHRAAPAALGAAVARYVVGEDGAGAPVDGAWEGPEHPEQEDARADVSAAPTVAEDGAGAHDALVPPSGAVLDVTPGFRLDPAPATDEAFATAREEVDALTSSLNMPETFRKVAGLLSLLERRMGAMARAVRLVREEMADEQEPTRVSTETARALAEALTDAPAVYTVEEVIGAAAVALVDYEATRDIPGASFERGLRVRLAALRR